MLSSPHRRVNAAHPMPLDAHRGFVFGRLRGVMVTWAFWIEKLRQDAVYCAPH